MEGKNENEILRLKRFYEDLKYQQAKISLKLKNNFFYRGRIIDCVEDKIIILDKYGCKVIISFNEIITCQTLTGVPK